MTLIPGCHLGPYEIVGALGAGGMGEVWRARDPKLGREVAIKVLPEGFAEDPERLKRFEQEARALAALSHPNVLTIFESGSQDGRPYLVMERLEGETLRQRLAPGPLPPRQALEVLLQAAQGLAAAHEQGILHRDLKPENLFLCKDGRVKVLDFGLAKPLPASIGQESETRAFLSAPGQVVGTIGYMSPEQVQGEPLDARSDLFSLGVVLWEMLGGHSPFQRGSAVDTLHAILHEPPPELPLASQVPPGLVRILDSCLAKDPHARFHSAHDLAFALENLGADRPGPAAEAPRPPQRKRWQPWATAGLLAVLAAAFGLWLWKPWVSAAKRTPSLVALPAKVLGSAESAFLVEAIPNLLTDLLSGMDGLEAKVPPSLAQVERLKEDFTRIAEAYRVENLVQSTVTAEGDRLLLSVRIAEGATQRVRWAAQYSGTRGTYTTLVRQAAEGVTQALRPAGNAPVGMAPFSSEVEVALREGNYFQKQYSRTKDPKDFQRALQYYQKAQGLAPSSALLAARIAGIYNSEYFLNRDRQAQEQSERWLAKALALDPRSGDAWGVKTFMEMDKAQADMAIVFEAALKAVQFAPDQISSLHHLGQAAPTFAFQQACGERALELNPLDARGYTMACAGGFVGRIQEALAVIERAERVNAQPGLWKFFKFLFLFRAGRLEEARQAYEEQGFTDAARLMRFLQDGDRVGGRTYAEALMARLRKREIGGTEYANHLFFLAPLLVRLGLEEDALWMADQAARTTASANYDFLLTDPDLRKIAPDPRFVRALAVARKGTVQFLEIADQARARGEFPRHLEPALEDLRELLRRNP